ncbi:MAG TPA: hypothetical protein VEP28_11665, partial [Rubrobacter sp.]|nr:hypothetical protein [Rubrobacter sp.]
VSFHDAPIEPCNMPFPRNVGCETTTVPKPKHDHTTKNRQSRSYQGDYRESHNGELVGAGIGAGEYDNNRRGL